MTNELPVAHPDYQRQIADFYREAAKSLAAELGEGQSVGLLAEGDPFFFGSFMHMWRRLEADFPVEVVPGVTGMSGCWTRANTPITWGDDILTVLTGTLDEEKLARRLTRDGRRRDHESRAQPREGAARRRRRRLPGARHLHRARHHGRASASCRSRTARR